MMDSPVISFEKIHFLFLHLFTNHGDFRTPRSGELDLSIWIPGCGKAQLRFHRRGRFARFSLHIKQGESGDSYGEQNLPEN